MEVSEFLKTRNRMCNGGCSTCPANSHNNGYRVGCNTLEANYTEKYVEIVERWGKLHPVKTRLDKLKELFPNLECLQGVPAICPLTFEGQTAEEFGCIGKSCTPCREEYWEGEYVQK